jgi:hypothetical protein
MVSSVVALMACFFCGKRKETLTQLIKIGAILR